MEWNDQIIDDAIRQSAASFEQSYPHDLPPSGDIWNAINVKRNRRKVVRMQKLWRVAASLLLLATFVTLWIVLQKGRNIIVGQRTPPHMEISAEEKEAREYIRQQCAGNNIVCQSPAFKELQWELESSYTELYSIYQQLQLFGNDEQLLRARTRIENHQARIVKAMLQIL